MSLKIQWVHKSRADFRDVPLTFFEQNYQQVVRVDELVRWLEGHKVVRSQAGPDLRGEYVNLTIEAMLAEIRALRGALRGA